MPLHGFMFFIRHVSNFVTVRRLAALFEIRGNEASLPTCTRVRIAFRNQNRAEKLTKLFVFSALGFVLLTSRNMNVYHRSSLKQIERY